MSVSWPGNAHHTTQDKAHENFARAAHMSQRTSHPLVKGSHDRVDDASHESPNEKETDDGIDENWFQAFQRLRQTFMAAVMIGGMVPPVAIAIATQCFRSKFTEKDRKSFVSTFVMGLAFITEGAIPFAAEDPMRVIPSCAIGAAVAGALSMYFGCSVPAPHGGIFVFGVVQNTGMYLVSLAVGSVVGAVLLGVLKKKV